jgi:ribosomal-protein-alanine N-acetyltransferase
MRELDEECFEAPFRFSRSAMRAFAEAPGAVALLAETAGDGTEGDGAAARLVGFCVVQVEEQTGYVVTLDVAASWRRRGVARLMMEEIEARVSALSGRGMELHTFIGNDEAIRFYERMGYGRVGTVPGFYGRGVDALLYRKLFEP